MAAFDLTENAFALLRTSPRATRAQLDDAYHDALLDAEDHTTESALNRAQQLLISPRERLENELSFFVEAKPSTVKSILAQLKARNADVSTDGLGGVDLTNLLAHLCGLGSSQQQSRCASRLIDAYDSLDLDAVARDLNALRSVSGFDVVDAAQIKSALSRLRLVHARAALEAILASENGNEHLASLANQLSAASVPKRGFLEALLQEYETRITPDLGHAAGKVRESLANLDARPDDQALHAAMAADLHAWDRLAQPLQNADRARGIDEHHSRELFTAIRNVCLSLANERGLYSQALQISQLAASVFSELPDAAVKLEEDIEALADLSLEQTRERALAPLGTAVTSAGNRHSAASIVLRKSGFSINAESPVREVFSAFTSLLHTSNDVALNGLAARLVRGLGIDLCNDSNDNSAALAVITGLLEYRGSLPADVIKTLEGDCDTLQRNINFTAMTEAMKSGQLDEAERLTEIMLDGADAENRQILVKVRSAIIERRKAKKRSLIGWGIAAAFVLLLVLAGQNPKSGSTPGSPATAAYDQTEDNLASDAGEGQEEQPVTAADDAPASTDDTATPPSSRDETPPSAYQGYGTVSLAELRYCKRQKARLETVQNETMSSPQIDRFNAAVDDFNARCSNFRYNEYDMTIVDTELARDQATIRDEGRRIIGSDQ